MFKMGKIRDFFDTPYILRVSDQGAFIKQRAFLLHGMYWIRRGNNMYPLRKSRMSRTAYELTEANPHAHQGALLDKSWTPLSKKMLAWYDMLPDENSDKGTDPQMPE